MRHFLQLPVSLFAYFDQCQKTPLIESESLPKTSSKPHSNATPSLGATLPLETLLHILSFLPNNQANAFRRDTSEPLRACSQVSRRWRAAAFPLVWSRLGLPCRPAFVDVLEGLSRFVIDARQDGRLFDYVGCVTTLEVVTPMARHSVVDLAAVMRPIEAILGLLRPGQLRNVVISFPDEVRTNSTYDTSSVVLAALMPYIGGIQSLRIIGDVNHAANIDVLLKGLPATIETLRLRNSWDSAEPPLITEPGAGVETYPTPIDNILLLPRIRDLDFGNRQLEFEPAQLCDALHKWGTRLRRVAVPCCHDDGFVDAMATHCTRLTSVEVVCRAGAEGGCRVSDASVQRLLDGCLHLEELRLVGLRGLTNEFLRRCAAGPTGLKRLVVVDMPKMTGAGVRDVHGWRKLEDAWIFARGEGAPRTLDGDFVRAVVEDCPALKFCRLGARGYYLHR